MPASRTESYVERQVGPVETTLLRRVAGVGTMVAIIATESVAVAVTVINVNSVAGGNIQEQTELAITEPTDNSEQGRLHDEGKKWSNDPRHACGCGHSFCRAGGRLGVALIP